MKRTLKLPLVVFGLLMAGVTVGREFRGPLPLMYDLWNPLRYPIEYHYDLEKDDDKWCNNWHFDVAGVGYHRSANDAFQCCSTSTFVNNSDCCCANSCCTTLAGASCCGTCCDNNTRCKVPWSSLLFGKGNFRLEEAFPGADVGTYIGTNPFVSLATLTPRFEYSESGAIFMAQLGTTFTCCDADYRLGLRARLPIRDFLVFDPCGISNMVGETLDDVWQVRNEVIGTGDDTKTNIVFAGRLDFLSALKRVYAWNPTYVAQDLVKYGDGTNVSGHYTTMAENQVDEAINVNEGKPVVQVIYRADGTVPETLQWGYYTEVGQTVLGNDGTGVAADTRGIFGATTDYTTLKNDTAAQSLLFVVPTVAAANDGGSVINEVVPGAKQIQAAIEGAIKGIDDSVAEFYESVGLNFCNGHNRGIGDLDLELYMGRNWGCDQDWWTDVMFGVRCPTGKQVCDCKSPLFLPLGNNKHTEIRLGAAAGYNACDWAKLMLHGSYSWALEHTERVAAPFQGATVKNLGPCVDAQVKWGYFLGNFDVSFFTNDCCGFNLGYELYYKRCDDICLCTASATDWAGRTAQPLDASVLALNTKQMGHKAKVGIFTIIGDCEIDGGWSGTFAGYNMPRETDFYLRMGVSF